MKNNTFIEKKEIIFGDEDGISELITNDGMAGMVQDLENFERLVLRKFKANLLNVKVDTTSVEVLVRNWIYEFSAVEINEVFGLSQVDERTHRKEWAGVLEDDLAEFMTDDNVTSWKGLQYSKFTEEKKMLYKICCSN